MKRKGLYVLATAAMLALTTGCGGNPGEENPQNQVTEAPEVTATTELTDATATPEPTATPAPTATPVPVNYMEANGIEVLGAGWHTCKGFIVERWDENDEEVIALADCTYRFQVEEEEAEGGTKIIRATLNRVPYLSPNGWSALAQVGFVDLQTGKAYVPMIPDIPYTTLLKRDEETLEIQIFIERELPSVTNPYYTERYTLICPAEYEDAGFYIAGDDLRSQEFVEEIGIWKLLKYIPHGKSDMLVFGVDEGLATMPEH